MPLTTLTLWWITTESRAGSAAWQTLGMVGGTLLVLVAHTLEFEDEEGEIIRIISARRAEPKENGDMKKRVKRTASNRPLTAQQRREIAAIAAMPDSEIDFSEIPRLPESFWKNAVRNPFYRPVKRQVTVRLDSDVIAWLRRQGKGYQTRLNYLLRAAMMQDVAGASNWKR
jgi:uncharacterized protein (DUF4415 family)